MSDMVTEAELFGMAIIAFADCIEVLAANQDREHRGEAMAYDGCHGGDIQELRNVLVQRGVLPDG